MRSFLALTLIGLALPLAAKQIPKGAMPELRISGTNEDENQKKALQSEVLISKTENKAIESLMAILKRRKGTPEEADLWNRLAELYMKRAKSGRFFDLHRDQNEAVKFVPNQVTSESASSNLRKAIQIYSKIDREFPKFREMDAVLFNAGFASHQIGLLKQAEQFYIKLVTQHPKSILNADAHLSLGEIRYQAQNFQGALEHFNMVQKYPQSRVYSYGLYKAAWTLYNLHQTTKAIDKLVEVVKYYDPKKAIATKASYNLRGEAIRDLSIFFEETSTPDKAYEYFAALTSPEELGDALIQLGKLYDSHSRHKDMNVFLNDYIQKAPSAPQRIKAHLLLIEANEALKNRKEVLVQLKTLDNICKKDSSWALVNQKTYDESCNFEFSKANIDIAKKWWDIWLKNKQHKEIADLTQQAFKIHLDREDVIKPDNKSRYAYAELLFQLEDYRKASEQYALVAAHTTDTILRHDADYSALVSFEKAAKKKKAAGDDEHILALSQLYLQKNPHGEHFTEVSFKVGFVNYENKSFSEAEKWLRPLASDKKAGEFKRKSEDLVLDILNARKDYKGIKEFSKTLLGQSNDESRKSGLTKILQEADYTEIQEYTKGTDNSQAVQKLVQFYQENKGSPLAKDSLWQAMSLSYSGGRPVEGADLAREYSKAYPTDARSLDGMKDAAKAYADTGHVLLAAQTMELIAEKSAKDADKYLDAAGELYLLEGDKKKAVGTLSKLLTEKNKETHGKIYAKILVSMKGQEKTTEYQHLEDKIVALGQEPFASEIRLKRVQQIFDSKKLTEAFNAAKPLVSSEKGIPDEVRAQARIIQAKVLEDEFVKQSTKTSVEKLSVVLSAKTEKLDKAQTAYLTAAKISGNPNVQLEALQGLNRIYKNYVVTVSHPMIKTKLTEDEKKALQAELEKLTKPIADKMDDTGKKLLALAKSSKAARSDEMDYANLPAEATVKATIKNPPAERIMPFLPVYADKSSDFNFPRFSSKGEKCSLTEQEKPLPLAGLAAKANTCITQGYYDIGEKIASQMTRNEPKSGLGIFYMSVMAGQRGLSEKALWLIDLSLKKNDEYTFSIYQKARILYGMKDFAGANKLFIKAYDLKLNAAEAYLMHGMVSFAEGDCFTVIDDFVKLDSKTLYNHNLGPAFAECHAQKGDIEKGFAVIKSQLQYNPANVDLLLQAAFMNEVYKSDTSATIRAYEVAMKAANLPEMKDWIQRKLDYLKGTPSAVSMMEK
jgi:TolA-binding protein